MDGRPATGVPSAAPVLSGPPGANKARTPCFFFAQGYCSKGDKCPFQHVGAPPSTPSGQQAPASVPRPVRTATTGITEANIVKKTDKVTNNGAVVVKIHSKSQPASIAPPPLVARSAPSAVPKENSQPSSKMEGQSAGALLQNGAAKGRLEGAATMNSNAGLGANSTRLRVRQLQSGDERVQNGVEGEEWWEESSPGFDVLVDAGPEQLRYNEEGQFQDCHEAELDLGRVGPASQRRGRNLYSAEEIDEYEGVYMGAFDQAAYASGQFNHGGYEAYDLHGTFDNLRHSGGVSAGNRGADEGYERGRDRTVVNFEGGGRGGGDQRWSQMMKRPRGDGHSMEKLPRRQRLDPSQESHSHRRMQEEAQKSRELHLRQQLFVQQQGISKNKLNGGRRLAERLPGDLVRRSEEGMKGDYLTERLNTAVSLHNVKGGNEQDNLKGAIGGMRLRSGEGERLWHRLENERRLQTHNAADSVVDDELRGVLPGVRQIEQKKEVASSFAGPKSLAQILAEKRKAVAMEDDGKIREAPIESRKRDAPIDIGFRNLQSTAGTAVEHSPFDTTSGEEKKPKLDKLSGQEPMNVAAFAGPKSLSAILQEKRRTDTVNSDDVSSEQIQSHNSNRVGDTSAHTAEATRPGTEMHFSNNGGLATVIEHSGTSNMLDQSDDQVFQGYRNESPAQRAEVNEVDVLLPAEEAVDNTMDVDYLTLGAERPGSYESNIELAEGEAVSFNSVEPEDEDEFGLDDEDDDFAKKLGGFFS